MKKQMIRISIAAMTAICGLCSCRSASELPPINDSYARDFILPDPVNLTLEDREYLEALEQEHENAIR